MSEKIISDASIPSSLWAKDVLYPPQSFVQAYLDTLTAHGLLEDAVKGTKEQGVHGGCSEEETKQHYKYRFIVSGGRSEISVLAPNKNLYEVSNALLTTFSQGKVLFLDIPAGAGASALSIIATIAYLRLEKVIPTLPLRVDVIAGDCSMYALDLYQQQLKYLLPSFRAVGIEVNLCCRMWDASRGDSTAALIRSMDAISSADHEYLICITNFSGALIDAGLLESFTPCLEQILSWISHQKSTLIWLEPAGTKASKKLPQKIADFIKKRIKWFSGADSADEFSFQMKDPVTKNLFTSNVQIQRFHRL